MGYYNPLSTPVNRSGAYIFSPDIKSYQAYALSNSYVVDTESKTLYVHAQSQEPAKMLRGFTVIIKYGS